MLNDNTFATDVSIFQVTRAAQIEHCRLSYYQGVVHPTSRVYNKVQGEWDLVTVKHVGTQRWPRVNAI